MRPLLAGILLAVCLACACAGEPPGAAQQWPLWDGQESVADYARRTGLEPTKTLDLGNDIKVELVLIPAGKFIMGTPEPEPPDEPGMVVQIALGHFVVACSVAVLLVMVTVIVIRAIREKHRPQFSLARLLAMVMVLGAGVLGGMHWYTMTAQLAREKAEYRAALTRYQEAQNWEYRLQFHSEKPAHEVTITKPFYMAKYEVTQEQYQQVMGTNPSRFKGATLPVETVYWDDVQNFCKRASAMSGVMVRLPNDAEWEYACRAGTRTMYHSGDSEADLDGVAWYRGNSGAKTHPVGTKNPNAWGLYDMHGNVWESCQDWQGLHEAAAAVDPKGPVAGYARPVRGGSWFGLPVNCRSAARYRDPPASLFNWDNGFRIVLDVR